MSRYHWWGFIVNEAGEPIENAEITVKIAGTDELASLYYDEFGNANSSENPAISGGPQLTTLSNGYYEFWIGDITEVYGYRNETKFKLSWQRIGVAYGEIDYINVFPLGPQTGPVSLSGCANSDTISREFNKLISDYLGCKWDTHVDSTVINAAGDFVPIHGLDMLRVDQLDTVWNKVVNNYHGFHWHEHRLSTVQEYHPSAGTPHNIEEVVPGDGSDTVRNKLISNADLYDIHTAAVNLKEYIDDADTYLQIQIDEQAGLTEQSKSGWWEIHGDEWVYDEYDKWYVDIVHGQDIYFPFVEVYEVFDSGSNSEWGRIITPTDIDFKDKNTVRITIENDNAPDAPDKNLMIRIANGGIHRHPELP